jgi:hypothetical protein
VGSSYSVVFTLSKLSLQLKQQLHQKEEVDDTIDIAEIAITHVELTIGRLDGRSMDLNLSLNAVTMTDPRNEGPFKRLVSQNGDDSPKDGQKQRASVEFRMTRHPEDGVSYDISLNNFCVFVVFRTLFDVMNFFSGAQVCLSI